MDREQRIALVNSLCEKAGCNEKVRKIHFHQLVNHHWNPHPPPAFIQWWKHHPEHNLSPTLAFNSRCYLEQFNAAQ